MPEPWRNRIVGNGEEAPDQLLANPSNWRIHTMAQQKTLEGVLEEVGIVQQVIVNKSTGFVVDGHMRVAMAISHEQPTIPVVYVDLSPDEEAKVLASFDPIGAMAVTDEQKLRELLEGVDTASEALITMFRSIAPTLVPGKTDPDELPAPSAQSYVERGDIWLLGDHRVMCGDSTIPADVARLMDGAKADAVFTSPPYLQQRDYAGHVSNDWTGLMLGIFRSALLEDDAQVFVNLGPVHRDGRVLRYWDAWIDEMESMGWPLFGWYVWDKQNGMPGDWNGRLAPAHEFVFHFARKALQPLKTVKTKHVGVHPDAGMRRRDGSVGGWCHAGRGVQPTKIPDSVIRTAPQMGGYGNHPAPFPVALPKTFLEAYACEAWFEPFLGSGTTIIAAEQVAGRRVFGMDIEPAYVQIAIERWQNFTGREAQKYQAGDLQPDAI